jgi:tetratricopeptide (TPR) repeat protein
VSSTATQLWAEAKAAFRRRDYAAAAELLETIVRDYEEVPGLEPGALELELGVVLLRLGRPVEGVTALEQAAALAPGDARARQKLGLGLARLGRDDEALVHLEHAAAMAPDNAEYQWRLGEQHRRLDRPAEAKAAFERALARDPGYRHAMEGLAALARRRGSWLTRLARALKVKRRD